MYGYKGTDQQRIVYEGLATMIRAGYGFDTEVTSKDKVSPIKAIEKFGKEVVLNRLNTDGSKANNRTSSAFKELMNWRDAQGRNVFYYITKNGSTLNGKGKTMYPKDVQALFEFFGMKIDEKTAEEIMKKAS